MAEFPTFLKRPFFRCAIHSGVPIIEVVKLRRPPSCSIILRVLEIGVCRSDVKEAMGTRHKRRDFGHELCAQIEWSDSLPNFRSGDRIVINPHVEVERGTGFAEFLVVRGEPCVLELALHRLPAGVYTRRMILTEPLACSLHCVSRLKESLKKGLEGMRIAVVGAGVFGSLIAIELARIGVRVVVLNRSRERLDFLKMRALPDAEFGDLSCIPREHRYDAVVVATSFLFPEVLNTAMCNLSPKGVLMLFGGTRPGDCLPGTSLNIDRLRRSEGYADIDLLGSPIVVLGTYGAHSKDFDQAISLLTHPIIGSTFESLIARTIELDDLPAYLKSVGNDTISPPGKTVVRLPFYGDQ